MINFISKQIIQSLIYKWSLSTRLSLVFLLTLIIPLILVVSWSDVQARGTISMQQEKTLTRISQDLAEKIDTNLNASLDELANLARDFSTRSYVELKQNSPADPQINVNEASIRTAIDDIRGRQAAFQSVNITGRDGLILFSTENLVGKKFHDLEPFFGRLPAVATITDVGISQISQKPAMYYIVPIVYAGAITIPGYILVRSQLQSLWDTVLTENDRYSRGSFVSLVDNAGIYLADGREPEQNLSGKETALPDYKYLFKTVGPIADAKNRQMVQDQRFGTAVNLPYFGQPDLQNLLEPDNHNRTVLNHINPQTNSEYTLGIGRLKSKDWTVVQEVPRSAFLDPINTMTLTSLAGLALVTILAVLLLLRLIKGAVQPILQLQKPIQRLSYGDLSDCEVQSDGSPELREIAQAFGVMATNLQQLVTQVRQSATQVTSAASEVQVTSKQQVSVATEQYSSIQTATSAMEGLVQAAGRITATVRQVSQVAAQTLNVSTNVYGLTNRVYAEIDQNQAQVEQSMSQILDKIGAIGDYVTSLNTTVKDIGKVVAFMEAVAGETHMLSLNAAIEAVGAGEYGERFAVVAAEVKSLAMRSQAASRQVRLLVNQLQTVTGQVVTVVASGTESAANAWTQIDEIRASISQVLRAVEEIANGLPRIVQAAESTSGATNEIFVITEEQLSSSYRVLEVMQELQETIQQGLTAHQQTLNVSASLNERASELNSAVAQFRLG